MNKSILIIFGADETKRKWTVRSGILFWKKRFM